MNENAESCIHAGLSSDVVAGVAVSNQGSELSSEIHRTVPAATAGCSHRNEQLLCHEPRGNDGKHPVAVRLYCGELEYYEVWEEIRQLYYW